MKKYLITLLSFLMLTNILFAQDEPTDFTNRDPRERERAPQFDRMNVVPNEVLVKFKDEVQLESGNLLKSVGISAVDRLMQSHGAENLEKLFPTEIRLKSARVVKDPLGQDLVIPSLHNIYKIVLPELKSAGGNPPDIFEFMQQLNEMPEVEYAEPNHIFTIGDFEPASPEMTMLEAMEQPANYNVSESATGLIPSDPLYNSQWGIPVTKIDVVWNTTTGDSTAMIAILDTGVDWNHPDLAANIWENKQEIPGNGRDDDGNGFIDDVRGWDFINHDNNPMDDNSHGTHVAGIAAAVGDNGIGIAGVNWNAKIMPIKVFQSSGRGDAATIAQGITYATNNGATVLNMSFGSYAESLTLKNVLANAYAIAVLVAAAGNDGRCIGPGLNCAPMYPAAFAFVLGVEANTNSSRAGFTNYDQDGPVFSQYADLLNYELKAPGTGILSCVPGGNYREYNGTSMAAPLVAGAVSLYRQQKPEESQELLFGNFIHSIDQHIDLEATLNSIPEPRLEIISYELQDTIDGDGDGRPDAGETIELFVKVRNTWKQVNEVKVGIEFGEFEDQSVAQIIINEATVGSISAYATRVNTIPLKIRIGENVSNGREIEFKLKTWDAAKNDAMRKIIQISVNNAFKVMGLINDSITWTPNRKYVVAENTRITEKGVLVILPGTEVSFLPSKSIDVRGSLYALGAPNSMVNFNGYSENGDVTIAFQISNSVKAEFNYCNYTNFTVPISFSSPGRVKIYNSIFNENTLAQTHFTNCDFKYNVIIQNSGHNWVFSGANDVWHNLFARNYSLNFGNNINQAPFGITLPDNHFQNNSFIENYWDNKLLNIAFVSFPSNLEYFDITQNYWGTCDSIKIQRSLIDFYYNFSPIAVYSPYLNKPSDKVHGHVWKINVNNKDAQDEFEQLDPIGVGLQKFEVYFNRAMDIQYPPTVSMGVRYPYTQTSISESGSWSADSTIYTVYGTIGLTTGDGINTIRVSGAQDTDHFEIPIEDRRFRVIVDAAGTASAGFQATPGLGRVDLEWNENDLDDGLGYNMYRMEHINDSTLSEPVMVNSTLIADTLFTDYNVVPNQKYFYYYKILRTNLTETDSSKVVAAVPFTADLGDANGDLSVNVSDIVTIVNYIMENNPAPFIHEAADLNGDGVINVLDIVGLVNLILCPEQQSLKGLFAGNAEISIENGLVYVTSPVALAGIQFTLADVNSEQEVEILEALTGFEVIRVMKDGKLTVLAYSLAGKTIGEGKTALLKLKNNANWISDVVLSNRSGQSVSWNFTEGATAIHLLKLNSGFNPGQNYPNPFTGTTTIPFELEMNVEEAVLSVYDLMGREVKTWQMKNLNSGTHEVEWSGKTRTGLYIYKMHIKQDGVRSYTKTRKMVIN